MQHLDLNADLGEGCLTDSEIIPLLSSANISCGAHAGTQSDIRRALDCCVAHHVVVGAHPSYPDQENFGRVVLPMSNAALLDSLHQQIEFLQAQAQDAGTAVHYIKLHGALYNEAVRNDALAIAIASFIHAEYPTLAILTQPGGALTRAAQLIGVPVFAEAFADRAYHSDGRLVSRSHAKALLSMAEAIQQVLQLATTQQIQTLDGDIIYMQADSICLHGDSPSALALAKSLRHTLLTLPVQIQPFCRVVA